MDGGAYVYGATRNFGVVNAMIIKVVRPLLKSELLSSWMTRLKLSAFIKFIDQIENNQPLTLPSFFIVTA
jgi:hypothetical protein